MPADFLTQIAFPVRPVKVLANHVRQFPHFEADGPEFAGLASYGRVTPLIVDHVIALAARGRVVELFSLGDFDRRLTIWRWKRFIAHCLFSSLFIEVKTLAIG
jgi:hypothetical protein